jgi:hypothetical protein
MSVHILEMKMYAQAPANARAFFGGRGRVNNKVMDRQPPQLESEDGTKSHIDPQPHINMHRHTSTKRSRRGKSHIDPHRLKKQPH